MKVVQVLGLLALLFSFSSKKGTPDPSPTIYVAGYQFKASGQFSAILWKNNEAIALSNDQKNGTANLVS